MKYQKTAKTYDEQADLLISRKMMGLRSSVIEKLSAVNYCRLWNRTMGIRPKIPQKDSAWHLPVEIGNDRMFGVLSICRYCLRRIAPQSRWQTRLEELFNSSPSIPIQKLGIPANWKSSPIWR